MELTGTSRGSVGEKLVRWMSSERQTTHRLQGQTADRHRTGSGQ